jgi:arylsulfatase A-like enzyme
MIAALALLTVPLSAAVTRPHIVVAVADDLGWNDVSFHGSEQIPTPELDKLAAAGVALDNYYVQPVCSPTRSSLLTGRHVIHSGIYDPDCGPGNTKAVPTEYTMLPAHLKKLGYETHAVGKWHLGMFSPDTVPTGRGFDTFYGYYSGAEDYFNHTTNDHFDFHNDTGSTLRPWSPEVDQLYSTHLYSRRAEELIADFAARQAGGSSSSSDEPPSFFLYLAFQAIHSPDEAPASYIDPFASTIPDTPDGVGQHRRIVAGMVSAMDEGVGNVTRALHSAGMTDRTLILFTSDNGGPAQNFNKNMASNWPLRGMKRTLWQGGVRAAGFLSGAGLSKSGYTSEAMLHVADLPYSLLAVAANGLDVAPGGPAWRDWREHPSLRAAAMAEPAWQLGDGIEQWAALSTGAQSKRTEVLIEAHPDGKGRDDGNGQAIVVGQYKLILEKGPMWHGPPNDLWYESGSNPSQYSHKVTCGPAPLPNATDYCDPAKLPCLFDLSTDPCEYRDLSASMPAKLAELRKRLEAYAATAVPASHHELKGINCTSPSPADHPEWQGNWMPYCAAAAPEQ